MKNQLNVIVTDELIDYCAERFLKSPYQNQMTFQAYFDKMVQEELK
jgi:hypothetical protein